MPIEIIDLASDSRIADWVEARLNLALKAAGDKPIAISVPGGSTPFPIFADLVDRDLDWSRISVWPGDDRIVPEDNPASNVGRIRAILEPPGTKVVALSEQAKPPHFALVWLGMGADGHVASLFPKHRLLDEREAGFAWLDDSPKPPATRVTMTKRVLANASLTRVVLATGAGKRDALQKLIDGDGELPIAQLGPLTVVTDQHFTKTGL